MDNNIRNLIYTSSEDNKDNNLSEAYSKLKKERQAVGDTADTVSPDLFVLCAEAAYKLGKLDVMEDCIQMFFLKPVPSNQFLCRAYFCQAQLHAPSSSESPEHFDKSVEFLLKAINFAKKNPRYYFLVYNASVLYWQFCRPFLRPNYRKYLAKSLHQVVKALDDIDDKDYDWRAQLMIALIECHVDAGRKEDATLVSNATLQFTKSNVPSLYTTVLGLQIRYRLIDISKVSKETKSSNELYVFYKIQRLRTLIETEDKLDVEQELGKLLKLIIKGPSAETDRSSTATSSATTTSKSSSPAVLPTTDRVPLLVDLARLCLENDRHELAAECLDSLRGPIKDLGMSLEVEFMKCELMVKSLGNKKENYSKNVVEVRIKAIQKHEQFLITAIRRGIPNIIQAGCVTMWNLCLPLLQPNLRHHVRKQLTLMAQALEDIDSLLVVLRCQCHMELAKCEEDEGQLEYALTHLQKALSLDDSGQYRDRLKTSLTRLQLRATLYRTPDRPEDLAAMIIEQARASDDASTVRMKRASLVKAGEALSPDAFIHVMDSENDTKDPSGAKGPPTPLGKLAGMATQYQKAVSKAAGHLKRLGDENDQERARIWADLAKTARKQHVWDVTRVAARFCLLYDNGRWSKRGSSGRGARTLPDNSEEGAPPNPGTKSPGPPKQSGGDGKLDPTGMKLLEPEGISTFRVEQDLMRTLADVHFIYAEALVQFLRTQNVQLGDKPIPPEDTVKLRPKRYEDQQVNLEEQPEWVTYCNWISSLSQEAVSSFQRAAEIGVELNEPWLICNSAVYLWNYTNHMLTQGRYREIVQIYTPVLDAMKATGHDGETILLCQLCNAICQGLMQPWVPSLAVPTAPGTPSKEKPDKADKGAKGRQSGKGVKGGASKANVQGVTIDPEGTNELKQALEVIEYSLNVTSGTEPKNLVPVGVRHHLIKTWVFCKQLLNQQIGKNLGHDDESPQSQGPMCKSLCALEMLSLQGNGLPEFQQSPTLPETVKMVESSKWSDRLVEVEVWSRLAVIAFNIGNHSLVMQCGQKAVSFAEGSIAKKPPKKPDSVFKHKVVVEQEMLYYASAVMGQSLVRNMQGRNEVRRDALICFVNACRFGQKAGNYELVITAARHYWNAIQPFIGEPIERELLKDPIEAVLECIAAVAGKEQEKDDEEEEEESEAPAEKKPNKGKASSAKGAKDKKGKDKPGDKKKDKDKGKEKGDKGKGGKTLERGDSKAGAKEQVEEKPAVPSAYDEELMMRAAMYGVLFQAYADKCDWEQGLRAMDQAIKDMPRTHHRLLIFKHRVITKAKLGRNVLFDMGKFKNANEDVISSMWRHVALNSADPMDQLSAYQNAIEVLESPESDWQKVDYLLEFGEWLFINEYPVADALDQFLWAADILVAKTAVNSGSSSNHGFEVDVDELSENGIDAAKYVPKTCQSVIGQRPSDLRVRTEEMCDVRQLESLCRVHVMLAQVAGHSSPHYTDYVLLAYGFLYRIWQVSIQSAEKTMKEGGKPGERVPSKRSKEKKDGKEDAFPTVAYFVFQTKAWLENAVKAGSKTCLPLTMDGWSTFELPEKLQEYFKCDVTGTMINKNTFQKPMLTVHYLQTLLTDLRDLGLHHLGLPVVTMQQLVADMLLEHDQLKKLIHLRALELCQELNLTSGMSHHEKAAGHLMLTEQQQAKSREEIEMWKEKQRQVRFEEERSRNSKSVLFDVKSSHSNTRGGTQAATPGNPGGEPWTKYKTLISGPCNRELWTEQAAILIRQGHFQVARQLLNEANVSARAFDDHTTLSHVLLQLAVLALAESNWGQATSLLLEAQKLKGDQRFWLSSTLLLSDAALSKKDKHADTLRRPDSAAMEKARSILVQAKMTFQDLSEDNPNKANMADYIEAVLEARLGIIASDHLISDAKEREQDPHTHKKLYTACQYLQRAGESLTQLGYRREAVRVMLRHADIKRVFADQTTEQDERHRAFIEAYNILKEATNIADAVLFDAQSTLTLPEFRGVSLPVQRDAVDARLSLADLMVDMFTQFSQEHRAKRHREARKGSMQKMIDDFVRSESTVQDDLQWSEITRSLAVDIMMQLSVAHGMATGVASLKAKNLLTLGRCLRALAAHTTPDAENQWKEIEQLDAPPRRLSEAEEKDEGGEGEEDNKSTEAIADQSASREILKYTNQALRLNEEHVTSTRYVGQAVECLAQAVQIGLRIGMRELVAKAAYEIVECIGNHDMSTTAQYLALYQSCYMSHQLEEVLCRAQADPAVSRQASLIRQRRALSAVDFLTDSTSSVFTSNTHHLGDCEAWRRLSVMRNHLELTKEFSVTNLQFVVLQHSPDRRFLYGAVLDKGRSSVPSGKPSKQTGSVPVPAKALVTRAEVNAKDLDSLIEMFEHFKADTASELMRQNYLQQQREQHRQMMGGLKDDVTQHQISDDWSINNRETQLQSLFQDVVAAVEAYLDPVLTKLQPALNPETISDAVVLLADDQLLRLPLEALTTFMIPRVTSLSRDFSLQFLYHRLHQSEDGDGKGDARKGGAKKNDKKSDKPSTAKSKPSDKKGGKELGSAIPKEGPIVDVNGIRYIVDPYNDNADQGSPDSPARVMTEVIAKYKTFAAKWAGTMGTDHLPSVGEFQRLLNESTGFLFYGTERCLGTLPPQMLAPMNISDCQVVFLMDRAQTSQSFQRQGREDSTKSVSELCLERPLETAMLFSMAGAGCVVANAWNCQFEDNKDKINKFFFVLLEEGRTTGQAVRSLIEFPKPPEPEADLASEKGSKHDPGKRGSTQVNKPEPEVVAQQEAVQDEPPSPPPRHWFGTVVYGISTLLLLPNKP
ncbi:cilia- and flagella-associated protein 46 isoform X2 [Nematostella vectensis]|uniref:cilia- and flagella-associated protein 46 isoform X2 n=1 Tax=Nematostella vectensis TaxID=45351 RepID=UPI002076EF12|nr:cilia- and flagella-associated protein 46 isoform X2 [Nematostella vectensis]